MKSLLVCLLIAVSATVALAQDLEGRFFADQDTYSLGEPLFFSIDVKNVGREKITIFARQPGHCSDAFSFTVQRSNGDAGATSCQNSWDTTCGDVPYELKPGESYQTHWPLDFWFRFVETGDYKASISRHFSYLSPSKGYSQFQISSEMQFKIVDADPAQVEGLMRKFEAELQSPDPEVRHDALDVMATTAPPYMLDTVLRLAHDDDIFKVQHAVGALEILNTPETHAALAQIITTRHGSSKDELEARCNAIQALGKSKDASYITLLAPYMEHTQTCESGSAMTAVAMLGGPNAVQQLGRYLSDPMPKTREHAAAALRNIVGPEAVEALIPLLRDKDEAVRSQASESLMQLTGHAVQGAASPLQMENQWRTWWNAHRDTPLMGPPEPCRL